MSRFGVYLVAIATLLTAGATYGASEAEWTAGWCGARGLVYDAPGDGERPAELALQTDSGRTIYADCAGESVTVEVDFADKYHEGVGQVLDYSALSGKVPVLLLIVEKRKDCRYVLDAWRLITRKRLGMILTTAGQSCSWRPEKPA